MSSTRTNQVSGVHASSVIGGFVFQDNGEGTFVLLFLMLLLFPSHARPVAASMLVVELEDLSVFGVMKISTVVGH